MAITDETLQVLAERGITLSAITDESTRTLVRAWVRTWDQISNDLAAALEVAAAQVEAGQRLTWRQASRVRTLQAALARAAASLDDLAAAGRVMATNAVGDVVSVASQFDPALIASQLPAGAQQAAAALVTGRMSGPALEAITLRAQERIVSLTQPLSEEASAAMRRELIRGVAVGDNPRVAAQRMLSRLEGAFNGGLTRSLRIARTEMLDAFRTADAAVQGASTDVVQQVVWTSTYDERTCPACIVMDGQTFPAGSFGPMGHVNCRCTFVPQVKTWKELGFAIPEPPPVRVSAREWFSSRPVEVQRQIMGPSRLEALNSGAIEWQDIARRTPNADWRPSYNVTPLKDLGVDFGHATLSAVR